MNAHTNSRSGEALEPAAYEAWYHRPRGAWIADTEFALMRRVLPAAPRARLLDAGCGTGHFSRRFAAAGFEVIGLDADARAVAWAARRPGKVDYVAGSMQALPFVDEAFDFSIAVTSLCFVEPAPMALAELWRVVRHGVLLGLLNRRSLLWRYKHGRGGYRGARWDTPAAVRAWSRGLNPRPVTTVYGSAVFFPGGGPPARLAETLLPRRLPWGGFLVACLLKPGRQGADS